jgi:pyridoxine 4-dehydrogenase
LLIADDFLVARLGLGTMRLTGKGIWGEPTDRSEAIRVVRRAIELGVNFIDTADSYGPDVSEGIIAEALYPYRKASLSRRRVASSDRVLTNGLKTEGRNI